MADREVAERQGVEGSAERAHAIPRCTRRRRLGLGLLCLIGLTGLACDGGDGPPEGVSAHRPASAIPTRRRDPLFTRRVAQMRALPRRDEVDVVFLGDSITQGFAHAGQAAFDELDRAWPSANFGVNGDRTEHVLWRIEKGVFDGMTPELVVVLIGTNNTPRHTDDEVVAGVVAVVEAVRARVPTAQVLLLGLFPKNPSADAPVRSRLAHINQALAEWAASRDVAYLDLGRHFLAADGSLPADVMPDGLHLSARGYAIWAEAMMPTLAGLLEPTPSR